MKELHRAKISLSPKSGTWVRMFKKLLKHTGSWAALKAVLTHICPRLRLVFDRQAGVGLGWGVRGGVYHNVQLSGLGLSLFGADLGMIGLETLARDSAQAFGTLWPVWHQEHVSHVPWPETTAGVMHSEHVVGCICWSQQQEHTAVVCTWCSYKTPFEKHPSLPLQLKNIQFLEHEIREVLIDCQLKSIWFVGHPFEIHRWQLGTL